MGRLSQAACPQYKENGSPMKNPKTTISASEVGKYTHCPYQWYYERYYGTPHLRELKAQLNRELGIEYDKKNSPFLKGQKFHNEYFKKDKIKRLLGTLALIALLIAVLAVVIFYVVV